MLAKSAAMAPQTDTVESHPVIRTLYDHVEVSFHFGQCILKFAVPIHYIMNF